MKGDDDEDTALLRGMLEQAKNYIESFSWCDSIISSYFAGGVGKVFAIFLFKINSSILMWTRGSGFSWEIFRQRIYHSTIGRRPIKDGSV